MKQDGVALITHLTVKKTLTYAGSLRLPNELTRQQKKERVVDVIHELGLETWFPGGSLPFMP